MQSPGICCMDNGHGACVADEHVACSKQVIQELPVSHRSVTAHCTGNESLPTLHTSLSLITVISLAAGAVPYGLSFHGQSSDSSEPDGRGLRGALGAASASPFKGQKN